MSAVLEGGEGSAARPGRTLPPGKTRYPFYRRLGGPYGRSGRAENLVPTGIRSRTVQPVVSRYTDWATQPIHIYMIPVFPAAIWISLCGKHRVVSVHTELETAYKTALGYRIWQNWYTGNGHTWNPQDCCAKGRVTVEQIFLLLLRISPSHYHSTSCTYSHFIHLPPTQYNRSMLASLKKIFFSFSRQKKLSLEDGCEKRYRKSLGVTLKRTYKVIPGNFNILLQTNFRLMKASDSTQKYSTLHTLTYLWSKSVRN